MEIIMSEKLKHYLKKKNIRNLTVEQVEIKRCWLGPNLPSVKEGEPKSPESYLLVKTEYSNVYIDKAIVFKRENINMDLRKFFLTHEITIDGVDITY